MLQFGGCYMLSGLIFLIHLHFDTHICTPFNLLSPKALHW